MLLPLYLWWALSLIDCLVGFVMMKGCLAASRGGYGSQLDWPLQSIADLITCTCVLLPLLLLAAHVAHGTRCWWHTLLGIGPLASGLCVNDILNRCGPLIKDVFYSGTSGWSPQLGGVINTGTCESGSANTNGQIVRCVAPPP